MDNKKSIETYFEDRILSWSRRTSGISERRIARWVGYKSWFEHTFHTWEGNKGEKRERRWWYWSSLHLLSMFFFIPSSDTERGSGSWEGTAKHGRERGWERKKEGRTVWSPLPFARVPTGVQSIIHGIQIQDKWPLLSFQLFLPKFLNFHVIFLLSLLTPTASN